MLKRNIKYALLAATLSIIVTMSSFPLTIYAKNIIVVEEVNQNNVEEEPESDDIETPDLDNTEDEKLNKEVEDDSKNEDELESDNSDEPTIPEDLAWINWDTICADDFTIDDIEMLTAILDREDVEDEQKEIIEAILEILMETLEEEYLNKGKLQMDGGLLANAPNLLAYQGPASYTSTYPGGWDTPNMSNLILFVGFSDESGNCAHVTPHTESVLASGKCALYPDCTLKYFNGSDSNKQGMQRYLYNISYGQLRVDNMMPQYDAESGTINPLILDGCASDYGHAQYDGALMSAVINKVNSESIVPNGLKLDRLTDGVIDNLTIVVLTDSGDSNSTYTYSYKSNAAGGTINGKLVGNYNILPEDSIYFSLGEGGTIAHEFLHSCGYPDLYRANSSNDVSSGIPVYRWCIMSSSDYRMLYPLAYLRSSISGWFTMDTINSDTTNITLQAATKTNATNKDHQAVILKTSYSDTEFFVVEYRYKSTDMGEYDSSLPGTGLIVYRVNTSYLTNKMGPPDMIYVFRPGDTFKESGGEKGGFDGVKESFLSAQSGRTSYGTADLSKTLTDNAITYSDGQNSGIVIENVGLAGDSIIFDISFNEEIENTDHWNSESSQANGATFISSTLDSSTGDIYVLEYPSNQLYKFNGNTYTKISSSALNTYGLGTSLIVYNGEVYASTIYAGKYTLSRFNGTGWDNIYNVSSEGTDTALSVGTDGLYLAYSNSSYEENSYKINVARYNGTITNFGSISESGYMYGGLKLKIDGSTKYLTYRNASGNVILVKKYDNGSWIDVAQNKIYGDDMDIDVYNGTPVIATSKAIGLGTNNVYIYNSNTNKWDTVGNQFCNTDVNDVSIRIINGVPYVNYVADNTLIKGAYYSAGVWVDFGNTVNEDNGNLKSYHYGGNIYKVYLGKTGVGTTKIVSNSVKAGGTNIFLSVSPSEDNYVLSLAIPSGYEDEHIYIDGISYSAIFVGNTASVSLPNGESKTAIMYKFKSNGAQSGMTVWKLSFANGKYTSTKLSGLTDLLGYHGFSIRVTGDKGIRYKSSISQADKLKLETTGIDGYTIQEMGTVCCAPSSYNKYGLALNNDGRTRSNTGAQKGRTYWITNGVKTDIVKEVVAQRDRFANVVLTPKVSMYSVAFYFRGYITLTNGTDTITLYSAPASRSVYTVAKQVMAANEFKQGTDAYDFVQGIITSVENAQ